MAAKIVEQWYNLVVWTIPKLGKFPRDQRFLLADKMQTLMCDILEDLIYSSYASKENAVKRLKECNLKLEMLRYYIRLSKDMKYVSIKVYHYLVKRINDIGRMIGGWIRYKLKIEKLKIKIL